MNQNKILEQFVVIFSVFMVFFYIGAGIYLIFFFETYLDRALLVILGSTLIFYGLFRAFRTYVKIVEVFFKDNKDDD
ncbi:MAG TPA: hypothetical protein VMW32_11725 [Bacteroidales bacterium]|nr:hypothetical protein [Bacteroidales bacterium]